MKEYWEKEKWIKQQEKQRKEQKEQGKVDVMEENENEEVPDLDEGESDDKEGEEDLFEKGPQEWVRATRRFMHACRKEDFWEVETGDNVFIHTGFTYSRCLAEAEVLQKEAKMFEEMVPERYHRYEDVFSEKKLDPCWSIDHGISQSI